MSEIVHHEEIADLIRALQPLASKAVTKDGHWISLPDGSSYTTDNGSDYCRDCAEKIVRRLRRKDPKRADEYVIDGGWTCERDTPPHCADCGAKLECILLFYGGISELDHFRRNPPISGNVDHAYEIREMLSAFEFTKAADAHLAREAIAIAKKLIESTP